MRKYPSFVKCSTHHFLNCVAFSFLFFFLFLIIRFYNVNDKNDFHHKLAIEKKNRRLLSTIRIHFRKAAKDINEGTYLQHSSCY